MPHQQPVRPLSSAVRRKASKQAAGGKQRSASRPGLQAKAVVRPELPTRDQAGAKRKPPARSAALSGRQAEPASPSTARSSFPKQGLSTIPQLRPANLHTEFAAVEQEDVLAELVAVLVKSSALEARLSKAALKALVERERLASTGVGRNVAIPHVQLKGLERAVFGLGLHRGGVEWRALDGAPVHLVFLVLRPEKVVGQWDPLQHLEIMGWIARLARDADFRRFARSARSPQELFELLQEKTGL